MSRTVAVRGPARTATAIFACNWALGLLPALKLDKSQSARPRAQQNSSQFTRLMCLGQVHAGLLLQALENGADRVLLLGCPTDRCRHHNGITLAERQLKLAQELCRILGLDPERLVLCGADQPARLRQLLSLDPCHESHPD